MGFIGKPLEHKDCIGGPCNNIHSEIYTIYNYHHGSGEPDWKTVDSKLRAYELRTVIIASMGWATIHRLGKRARLAVLLAGLFPKWGWIQLTGINKGFNADGPARIPTWSRDYYGLSSSAKALLFCGNNFRNLLRMLAFRTSVRCLDTHWHLGYNINFPIK